MAIYSKLRKYTSSAKKYLKKGAKSYLKVRRNKYVKGALKTYGLGKGVSTVALAKQIMDLKRRVNASGEYKLIDTVHQTGSPDVTLREFHKISASASLSTVSTTTTAGTTGYFLTEINMPSAVGDGITSYDGKRISLESIQWKGSLYSDTNSSNDGSVKMMIIRYQDEDGDNFNMSEFLNTDNNGEYSVMSKRNFDYKNYKIVSSRYIKLSTGSTRRKDFNIFVKPRHIIRRFQTDNNISTYRYFALIVGSTDVGANNTQVNYVGNTRIRYVA